MPTYSQGPRLLKGAIVAAGIAVRARTTIVYPYNSAMPSGRIGLH